MSAVSTNGTTALPQLRKADATSPPPSRSTPGPSAVSIRTNVVPKSPPPLTLFSLACESISRSDVVFKYPVEFRARTEAQGRFPGT